MNFVGHAHVALSVRPGDPAFVLGAMLPDFASMSGARLVRPPHPSLADGVDHHHHTDELFHGAPDFVRLCTEVSAELDERGVSWGAARAVAHVGVELLLDGFLLDDPSTCEGYLLAIHELRRPDLAPCLLAEGRGADRWPTVLARVRTYGLPDFYRDPDAVADRLVMILANRPRLAIPAGHEATVRDAMRSLRPRVELAMPALVAAASGTTSAPRRDPPHGS